MKIFLIIFTISLGLLNTSYRKAKMSTIEKQTYTGIDKIDHFNQRHFQNEERERAMKMLLEEQAQEAAELEEKETNLERTKKVALVGSAGIGLRSYGVAALLAAMAAENMSMAVARGKSSRVRPYDGQVKRSTLTREDFPSRQAWRAHKREQEKAQSQGKLYDE